MTGEGEGTATEHGIFRRIHLGTRKPQNWLQLLKFGVVGGSGAILSFCVAVTNNFWWNRHWTFKAGEGHAGFQAIRFFVVSVLALVVNLVVLQLLVEQAGMDKIAAQAIAVAVAMPFNFVGNKLWTFT
jgi:dolichol-phosphate mannosyltransferase